MKISSLQENLKQGLMIVGHIAGKNVNLPILNNILIEASDGKIKLISTNLEIGISSYVRGKIEQEGKITVDSKTISDYVSLLSNKKIEIEVEKESLKIKSENYNTKLKAQDAEEYPLIPQVDKKNQCRVDADDFRRALSKVVFAVSNNETRLELSGVFFDLSDGKITMAATDSYRLSESVIKTKDDNSKTEGKMIVPAKTLVELVRILSGVKEFGDGESGDLVICFSDNQILFEVGATELVSRLIEGQYPDYKQIIPGNSRTTITINKSELTKAVKASAIFSKTGVNDVSLDFPADKNQTVITAESGQTGESVVLIDSSVVGNDNGIVVNHRYLLDGLNSIDSENVKIEVVDNNTPCVLKPEKDSGQLYIIMPIKQ
jgi:DNA polymerase-3 subunit beta